MTATPLLLTIAEEAALESPLWRAATRPVVELELDEVFSPLGDPRYALALETIYEGYLMHYGRPRLFAPADADTGVLLGDYLFAHGLVHLTAVGDVRAVGDLSELISVCTQLRAAGADTAIDGVAWAATAALVGRAGSRLERARAPLRLTGDVEPLRRLAREAVGEVALGSALAAHAGRVEYDTRRC